MTDKETISRFLSLPIEEQVKVDITKSPVLQRYKSLSPIEQEKVKNSLISKTIDTQNIAKEQPQLSTIDKVKKLSLAIPTLLNPTKYVSDTPQRQFGIGVLKGLPSGATMGLAENLGGDKIKQLLEAQTAPEKLGKEVGIAGGMAVGLPSAIAGGAAKVMSKIGSLPNVVKGAVNTAIYAGTYPEEKAVDRLENIVKAEEVYALGSIAFAGLNKVRKLMFGTSQSNKLSFIRDTEEVLSDIHQKEMDKYGQGLKEVAKANQNQPLNLQDRMTFISAENNAGFLHPKIKALVNKSPLMKSWITNPESAKNITIGQADQALTEMEAGLPTNFWKKRDYNTKVVKGFINNIKGEILENAQGLDKVKSQYAQFIQPFKVVDREVQSKAFMNKVAQNSFDPRVRDAIDKVLPKEILARMKDYKQAVGFIEGSKELTKGLIYLIGGGYGVVKVGESLGLAK